MIPGRLRRAATALMLGLCASTTSSQANDYPPPPGPYPLGPLDGPAEFPVTAADRPADTPSATETRLPRGMLLPERRHAVEPPDAYGAANLFGTSSAATATPAPWPTQAPGDFQPPRESTPPAGDFSIDFSRNNTGRQRSQIVPQPPAGPDFRGFPGAAPGNGPDYAMPGQTGFNAPSLGADGQYPVYRDGYPTYDQAVQAPAAPTGVVPAWPGDQTLVPGYGPSPGATRGDVTFRPATPPQ